MTDEKKTPKFDIASTQPGVAAPDTTDAAKKDLFRTGELDALMDSVSAEVRVGGEEGASAEDTSTDDSVEASPVASADDPAEEDGPDDLGGSTEVFDPSKLSDERSYDALGLEPTDSSLANPALQISEDETEDAEGAFIDDEYTPDPLEDEADDPDEDAARPHGGGDEGDAPGPIGEGATVFAPMVTDAPLEPAPDIDDVDLGGGESGPAPMEAYDDDEAPLEREPMFAPPDPEPQPVAFDDEDEEESQLYAPSFSDDFEVDAASRPVPTIDEEIPYVPPEPEVFEPPVEPAAGFTDTPASFEPDEGDDDAFEPVPAESFSSAPEAFSPPTGSLSAPGVADIPSGINKLEGKTVVMPLGELLRKVDDGEMDAAREVDGRKVWAIYSAKGGVGSTMLTINLAAALADQNRRSCLIDLSLQFGDLLTASQLQRNRSLAWLQQRVGEGIPITDEDLSVHGRGFSVISQVGSLDDLDVVDAIALPSLMREVGSRYEHILIEGMTDFSEVSLGGVDCADKIIVMTTNEIASVKRAKRMFEIMERIGVDTERDVWIVVSDRPMGSVDLATMEEYFTAASIHWLPYSDSAGKAMERQQLVGEIAKDSLYQAIQDLAADMMGIPRTKQSGAKKAPWWKRLFGQA